MTDWQGVWLKHHEEEKAYTFAASNNEAEDLTMQRQVVMAITLPWDALNTRVASLGTMLLIYLNPHPGRRSCSTRTRVLNLSPKSSGNASG